MKRKPVSGEAEPSPIRVFFSHHVFFPYQVANLLCNEFITSKTFLLEFANYKTFINNKTFVGPLTRMAGKRDVMTCALSLV